jgi:hypothetical protein
MNLVFTFLGTLTNVILTYISHPITSTTLTTGYNTYLNSGVTPASGFSLFNPVNNLNNLGSLNAVAFYGLTIIDLVSTSSLNIEVNIQYSYTTFITTYGSTVNIIGTSYYFYGPLSTNIINNLFDGTPVITNGVTASTTASFNSYTSIPITSSNGGTNTATFNSLVSGATYWLSFNLADSQACSGLTSGITTLTVTSTSFTMISPSTIPSTSNTVGNTYYWSSPYRTCPTTPLPAPVAGTNFEVNYRNYLLSFTTGSATSGSVVFTFTSNPYNSQYTIYLSNIIIVQASTNQIIDWNIEASSLATLEAAYAYQATTGQLYSSSFTYTPVTTSTTPYNAI